VKLATGSVYIRLHLEFFNGHVCNFHGVATYEGGAFVYRRPRADRSTCALSIRPGGAEVVIEDPGGSCKDLFCGARGGLGGTKFEVRSRRKIRYLKRLKASREFAEAVQQFTRLRSTRPAGPR
jgi:hypothetical protein